MRASPGRFSPRISLATLSKIHSGIYPGSYSRISSDTLSKSPQITPSEMSLRISSGIPCGFLFQEFF